MSDRMDALAQALFNKPSLQDCSLQQVDYLAHQYPYFSTAQLLLLQKSEPESDTYANKLQRTALHFSNPLQLQYWLQPAVFETEIPEAELFQNPIAVQPEITEAVETAPDVPTTAPVLEQTDLVETPIPATPQPEPTDVAAPSPESGNQTETAPLAFEPYHTVDYFASQGIRLAPQEASNDALGKQLKSFTEWLKTMKRLPATTVSQRADPSSERNVENLAAHSLDMPEVVTESMAEVWLKQGATEKAADVYRKLSLRIPAKSAYFAAKIDALKQL